MFGRCPKNTGSYGPTHMRDKPARPPGTMQIFSRVYFCFFSVLNVSLSAKPTIERRRAELSLIAPHTERQ